MATLAQIRNAVDTRLANLWTTIQAREDQYATNHNGRYWQGLLTHAVYPADGTTVLPTVGLSCPTDQPGQSWPSAILTTPIEMALQIDCYDGPLGQGYQARVFVAVLGTTWTRTAQAGPETWRPVPWNRVTVLGVP